MVVVSLGLGLLPRLVALFHLARLSRQRSSARSLVEWWGPVVMVLVVVVAVGVWVAWVCAVIRPGRPILLRLALENRSPVLLSNALASFSLF